jgi:hypothetical protein
MHSAPHFCCFRREKKYLDVHLRQSHHLDALFTVSCSKTSAMLIFSGPTGVLTASLAQPLDPKPSGGRGSSPRSDPCPFHKLSSLPPLSLSTAARRWPLYPEHAACLLNHLVHPAVLYLANISSSLSVHHQELLRFLSTRFTSSSAHSLQQFSVF